MCRVPLQARDSGQAALAEIGKGGKRKEKTYVKADVFSRRVLEPRSEPTKAETLNDAFGISLGWTLPEIPSHFQATPGDPR